MKFERLVLHNFGGYKGENVIGEGPLVLEVQATGKWTMKVSP